MKNPFTPEQLSKLVQEILRRGPDRVVINSGGEAVPPRRAREEHGIDPTVIFIRDDGWSLGAPADFEQVAHKLWANEWIAFVRKPEVEAKPIREYVYE